VWVAGGDRVLGCASGATRTQWRLPRANAELLSELIPLDEGGALVTSNAGRILRGRAGVVDLADWSQGLPMLHGGVGSPTIGRVGDAWLAFLDGLHVRRDGDPVWVVLLPDDKPDGSWRDALRWLAPTESAQWMAMPWQPGTWLGTDGANLFTGGPGRPLSSMWRRPDGRTSIKRLAVSERAVYSSLRNATLATAGVAVRRDGAHALRLG
jgi:hypothetical protein